MSFILKIKIENFIYNPSIRDFWFLLIITAIYDLQRSGIMNFTYAHMCHLCVTKSLLILLCSRSLYVLFPLTGRSFPNLYPHTLTLFNFSQVVCFFSYSLVLTSKIIQENLNELYIAYLHTVYILKYS